MNFGIKFGWIVQDKNKVMENEYSPVHDYRDIQTQRIENLTRVYHSIYHALENCCLLTVESTTLNLCLVSGKMIEDSDEKKKKNRPVQNDILYPVRFHIVSIDISNIALMLFEENIKRASKFESPDKFDKWTKEWCLAQQNFCFVRDINWSKDHNHYGLLTMQTVHSLHMEQFELEKIIKPIIYKAIYKNPDFYKGLIMALFKWAKWKFWKRK